jgi:Zn-dependent membrane protease YugP
MLVSMVLKSKFTSYSKIPLANGMTGREVAEKCSVKMAFMM